MSTADLLRLSILYRTLVDDIERLSETMFTPDDKRAMDKLVAATVGQAVMTFVARCNRCDLPIELVCDACLKENEQ